MLGLIEFILSHGGKAHGAIPIRQKYGRLLLDIEVADFGFDLHGSKVKVAVGSGDQVCMFQPLHGLHMCPNLQLELMRRFRRRLGPVLDVGAIFRGEESANTSLLGPGDEFDLFFDAGAAHAGHDRINSCCATFNVSDPRLIKKIPMRWTAGLDVMAHGCMLHLCMTYLRTLF